MAVRLAPSVLSADFAALGAAVRAVEDAGADLIHVDVMDGHFVPNITIGPLVVQALKRVSRVPLDVHLMISAPDQFLDAFIEAGADMVSVHVEAARHLHRSLDHIRKRGVKAGVVLNPSTPVCAIEQVVGDVDFVLVMSVNPGFAGQPFIPNSLAKVRAVRALLQAAGNHVPIEIDGGIEPSNAALAVEAGVDILVAGSAVFGHGDPGAGVRALRAAVNTARVTLP